MKSSYLAPFALLVVLAGCDSPSATSSSVDGTGGVTRPGAGSGGVNSAVNGVATPLLSDREKYAAELQREPVLFTYDSSALTPEGRTRIEHWAQILRQDTRLRMQIAGHADERGTREYNIGLGERRAFAARMYLVSLGVEPGRLSTISYGKERPQTVGSDENAWAQNRRAVAMLND